MKTLNQKLTNRQEIVTAAFVIASLVTFFAVVIYNSITHLN